MGKIKRMLPISHKKKNANVQNFVRWVFYILLIFLAFLFATSGNFLKPTLLIPIVLSICSVSRIITSACVGIFCGFLMDMTSGTLMGYHAILLFLIGMAVSVLYDKLIQQRFFNFLIFTIISAGIITGVDFLFKYGIWGYDHVSYLYIHHSLPCLLLTSISSIIIYPIFYFIHKHFLPERKRTIEKKLKLMKDTEES